VAHGISQAVQTPYSRDGSGVQVWHGVVPSAAFVVDFLVHVFGVTTRPFVVYASSHCSLQVAISAGSVALGFYIRKIFLLIGALGKSFGGPGPQQEVHHWGFASRHV